MTVLKSVTLIDMGDVRSWWGKVISTFVSYQQREFASLKAHKEFGTEKEPLTYSLYGKEHNDSICEKQDGIYTT